MLCMVGATLYECETWTISKAMKDQLMAVEIWFLRRMLWTSWTEKKSNVEVMTAAIHTAKLTDQRGRYAFSE